MYLRERMATGATDVRTKAVYEGLLDVLDPTRRTARMQREAASAAQAAVTVQRARERRLKMERRARENDRRKANLGPPYRGGAAKGRSANRTRSPRPQLTAGLRERGAVPDRLTDRLDQRIRLAHAVGDRDKRHAARPRRALQRRDVAAVRDDDVGEQREIR